MSLYSKRLNVEMILTISPYCYTVFQLQFVFRSEYVYVGEMSSGVRGELDL